jgi:hypothetical protein
VAIVPRIRTGRSRSIARRGRRSSRVLLDRIVLPAARAVDQVAREGSPDRARIVRPAGIVLNRGIAERSLSGNATNRRDDRIVHGNVTVLRPTARPANRRAIVVRLRTANPEARIAPRRDVLPAGGAGVHPAVVDDSVLVRKAAANRVAEDERAEEAAADDRARGAVQPEG